MLNAELERRVVERTQQLEGANAELEAFSYSVSHDLRAPLRAIDGFTRILLEDYASQFDPEGRRLCSVIHENTVKMSQLIDDLLAFARLGRSEMSLTVIDMGSSASADATLMRQVWTNVLSNAIKFSSKRERAIIEVSAVESAGETPIHTRGHCDLVQRRSRYKDCVRPRC